MVVFLLGLLLAAPAVAAIAGGAALGHEIKQYNGRRDAQRDLDNLHQDYDRSMGNSIASGYQPQPPEQFLQSRLGPEWYNQYDHMRRRADGRETIL